MPCNCDHMNPTTFELGLSRVACLLDELDGKPRNNRHWEGYHPRVYNHATRENGDELASDLCTRLQETCVADYSLEMQLWWRDHQEADKKRIEKELSDAKRKSDKAKALTKLSSYERRILGL